jgi:hypothetical protein
MDAMISNRTDRTMSANSNGTASYTFEQDEAPAWLVSAVPGAAEAREAWLAENERGRELTRAKKAAEKAAPATKLTPIQNGVGATAGPADGVTYAEWEVGQASIREAENAVKVHARRALAALKKYDSIAYGAAFTPSEVKAIAAEFALKRHAAAEALLGELLEALKDRDEAHRVAGSPGRRWEDTPGAFGNTEGKQKAAEEFLKARVSGYDTDAVARVAAGDEVKSAFVLAEDARRLAEEARKASAAAARKRAGVQGFN